MVYCILPAYNEEKSISRQTESLKNFFERAGLKYQLVIINDGSTDGTSQEIEKTRGRININSVNHKVNAGPGMAFKSGFNFIMPLLEDADIIVSMDCDNTLDLEAINLMINKLREGYDVAVGSVFLNNGGMIGVSLLRQLFTLSAKFIYQIIFPIQRIGSYTGFYRAIKGSALKLAHQRYGEKIIESRGFSCMAEMLIKLGMLDLLIAETPMVIRYNRKTSATKLKIAWTIKEHFAVIKSLFLNFWYFKIKKIL